MESETVNVFKRERRKAETWLAKKEKDKPGLKAAITKALAAIAMLQPTELIQSAGGQLNPSRLFGMLGVSSQSSGLWLWSEHIDLLLQPLLERCIAEARDDVIILNTSELDKIMSVANTPLPSVEWMSLAQKLARLRDPADKMKKLVFIVNVDNSHWYPMVVDVATMEVYHGDSLMHGNQDWVGPKRRQAFVSILQRFVEKENLGHGQLKEVGKRLTSGIQDIDRESCGFCSVNAISHWLFGDTIWREGVGRSDSHRYRIEMFTKIIHLHLIRMGREVELSDDPPDTSFLQEQNNHQKEYHHLDGIDPSVGDMPVVEQNKHSLGSSVSNPRPMKLQRVGEASATEGEEKNRVVKAWGALLSYKKTSSVEEGIPAVKRPNKVSKSPALVKGKKASGGDEQKEMEGNGKRSKRTTQQVFLFRHFQPKSARSHDVQVPPQQPDLPPSASSVSANDSVPTHPHINFLPPVCALPREDVDEDDSSSTNSLYSHTSWATSDEDNRKPPQNREGLRVAIAGFLRRKKGYEKKQQTKTSESSPSEKKNTSVRNDVCNAASRKAGDFKPDPKKKRKFRAKVKENDPGAQFHAKWWLVKCGRCQKWLSSTSGAYSMKVVNAHRKTCPALQPSALSSYMSSQPLITEAQTKEKKSRGGYVDCDQLSPGNTPALRSYFRRFTARGGLGRAHWWVSDTLFGKKRFTKLRKKKRRSLEKAVQETWKFRSDPISELAWSNDPPCRGRFWSSYPSGHPEARICDNCLELRRSKEFRRHVSAPVPTKKHFKHTPRHLVPNNIGEKLYRIGGISELFASTSKIHRLGYKLAVGICEGKFGEDSVLAGIIDVELQKQDKADRGVGLQNMHYPTRVLEMYQYLHCISPAAADSLRDHLTIPHDRQLRTLRAKETVSSGAFVSSKTFDAADIYVTRSQSPGRVAMLAVDDTKLVEKLKPYYSKDHDTWFIAGSVTGMVPIEDPQEVRAKLTALSNTKATKVRVWTLHVPAVGVPPIILATRAIGGSNSSVHLKLWTDELLAGLAERNIHVLSYSTDGAANEYATQSAFIQDSTAAKIMTEPVVFPRQFSRPDVVISSPKLYLDKPTVMVTDSKHAFKTLKNPVHTGARALTIGNYAYTYSDLVAMTGDGGTLFHKDVFGADKQDDRGASRYWGFKSLDFIARRPPATRNIGQLVYLGAFGEALVASQSRSMPHIDRARCMLTTYHFLDLWEVFLATEGYSLEKHCIAWDARKIVRRLVLGYLELLIVYRDHVDEKTPFLPWMHSTEVIEHIFAEARKQVTDFDYAVFLHLIAKIHQSVRLSMNRSIGSLDPKGRKRGGAHTWGNLDGIDLASLASFPSNDELYDTNMAAFADALVWCEASGMVQQQLFRMSSLAPDATAAEHDALLDGWESDDESSDTLPVLDSISEWYDNVSLNSRITSSVDDFLDCDRSSRRLVETMMDLECEAGYGPRSVADEKRLCKAVHAKLGLDLDLRKRIDEMPEYTDTEWENTLTEYSVSMISTRKALLPDMSIIRSTDVQRERHDTWASENELPPVVLSSSSHNGHGNLAIRRAEQALNDVLRRSLEIRLKHETEFIRRSARSSAKATNENGIDDEVSQDGIKDAEKQDCIAHRRIAQMIYDGFRDNVGEDGGSVAGMARRLRWTGSIPKSGNSKNAAKAANARADAIVERRLKAFHSVVGSYVDIGIIFRDAGLHRGVDATTVLRKDTYGLLYVEHRNKRGQVIDRGVQVCRIIDIFTSSGGRRPVYMWLEEAKSIGLVANLAVQIYFHDNNGMFTSISPPAISQFRTKRMGHVPGIQFLAALGQHPLIERDTGPLIELTADSLALWKKFTDILKYLGPVQDDYSRRAREDDTEESLAQETDRREKGLRQE